MSDYDFPLELRKGLEARRLKLVSDQHKYERGEFMEKVMKICQWIGETERRREEH